MTATVTNRWWWLANEWKSLFHAQINFPLYTINHSTMDCYDYDTFLTVCCLKLGLKINIFRLLLVVKVPIELLSTWHAMCCEVVQNLPPKNIPSLSLTAVPYTSSHSPTQIFELLFRFGRSVCVNSLHLNLHISLHSNQFDCIHEQRHPILCSFPFQQSNNSNQHHHPVLVVAAKRETTDSTDLLNYVGQCAENKEMFHFKEEIQICQRHRKFAGLA